MALRVLALPNSTVGRIPTSPVQPALADTFNPMHEATDQQVAALAAGLPLIADSVDDLSDFDGAAAQAATAARPLAYVVETGEAYVYDRAPSGYVPPAGSIAADGGGQWLPFRAFPPGGFGVKHLVATGTLSQPAGGAAVQLFGGAAIGLEGVGRPVLVTFSSEVSTDSAVDEIGSVTVEVVQGGAVVRAVVLTHAHADETSGADTMTGTLAGSFVASPPSGSAVSVRAKSEGLDHAGTRTLTAQLL